jgi:guanylate kinase
VRIRTARDEIQQVSCFDYLVINEDFADAANQICSILVSEKCRREQRAGFWVDKWTRELEGLLKSPF